MQFRKNALFSAMYKRFEALNNYGAGSAPPTRGRPKPFRCQLFRRPSVRETARADLAVRVCNR
jgi:hypothetical protein